MANERYLGDVPKETRPDKQSRKVVGPGGPQHEMERKRKRKNSPFINRGFVAQLKSKQAVIGNSLRNYLLIQNNSASTIYVAFGNTATVFNGVKITAGGYYEPYKTPTNSINIIAAVADSNVVIVEGLNN